MNIIHIFKNTNDKFYKPFIIFINDNFNKSHHYFMIEKYLKNEPNKLKLNEGNIEEINASQYWRIIIELYKSDKIILHSLMSPRMIIILFLQPWLLKKCYWGIWGGDLYYHVMRKKTIKSNLYDYLRKSIIKKMGGLITQIKGDYELAQDWYGARGKYYYSFMYPSNLYKEYPLNKEIEPTQRICIQIGNSADPSNNHIEILDKLQIYKDEDIEIMCPLSYGDKKYADKVIAYGNKIFGNKFIPITHFMPFDKYLEILSKIDVAIFNHKRQQALGNITTLLGLGKKVYIREEITTWQFCLDHDLNVYSANGDFNDLFEEMDEDIKKINIENVKTKFSEEKLIKDLKMIFDM